MKFRNDDLAKLTIRGEKCNKDYDTINTSKDNEVKKNWESPLEK